MKILKFSPKKSGNLEINQKNLEIKKNPEIWKLRPQTSGNLELGHSMDVGAQKLKHIPTPTYFSHQARKTCLEYGSPGVPYIYIYGTPPPKDLGSDILIYNQVDGAHSLRLMGWV